MSLVTLRATPQRDPTRTLVLRRRFAAALRRRLRAVLRLVRQAILVRDVFGMRTHQATLPPEEAFSQGEDDQQVNAFMAWLWGVLAATLLTPRRWWERYVRPAYDAGWARGQQQVPGLASGPGAPPVPPAGLPTTLRPQTPAWRGLTDLMQSRMTQLTATTAQAIREALSHTITQTPAQMAEAVTEAMQPILRRADVLAETSIVEAHATGTLDALQLAGITAVTITAERVRYVTAGDDRVCAVCRPWEGRIIPIAQARGLLPRHPRCRCAFVPVSSRSGGRAA